MVNPFDPYYVLAEIERQTGGAPPDKGAIFVSQIVLDYMVQLPVKADPPSMAPPPATTYLGLPVYLDPTLPFGGFVVILDLQAVDNQLFMIAHALAIREMSAMAPRKRS